MKRFYLSKLLILTAILLGNNSGVFGQSFTFSYTGSIVNWTVPAGMSFIGIKAVGGSGGGSGGKGASVYGSVNVVPGSVLKILVGQVGNSNSGYGNGGGGGGSFVTTSANVPLVIAGGGGGQGESGSPGQDAQLTTSGGSLGTLGELGGTGGNGGAIGGNGGGGGCGFVGHGGGGLLTDGGGVSPTGGKAFVNGGAGGTDNNVDNCVNASVGGFGGGGAGGNGGGGGGGYSGGAGGTNSGSYPGGGGGGSYCSGTLLATSVTNVGNGTIMITSLCVTPVNGPVKGANTVCVAAQTTYSTSVASGGTWYSSNTSVATVGSTGIVTGVSAGTSSISYSLVLSCGTGTGIPKTITVNPNPAGITGSANACLGLTNTLSDITTAGTWSSANTAVAAVGSGTGIVTGIGLGVTTISYSLSTGCYATQTETVNPLPTIYNVSRAGSGVMCTGGSGFHISLSGSDVGVSYQLYNGITPISGTGLQAGTGSGLDFGLQTGAGTYKVIATNTSTGCPVNMNGNPTITVNPLPTPYPVTISGSPVAGAYCAGSGGVDIQVTNSQTGTNYQLYLLGSPVGSPLPGASGSALDFGLQTAGGVYNITATNISTTCSGDMANTVTEVINPLPSIYSVTGGGSYCSGSGGKTISVGGSQVGVNYELLNSGTPTGIIQSGTGSSLNFNGVTAAGSYTVRATNTTTSCTSTMSGSVLIAINPLPTPYAISASTNYCPGGAGADINLAYSSTGVSYQLYNTGGPIGSAILGTGSPIDFGLYPAGTYNIIATNVTTSCTNGMTGVSTIGISPLPTAFAVTGGGPYCAGGGGLSVGLGGSDATAKYQLYNGVTAVGIPVTGTGSPFTFGVKTDSGTYTVVATGISTGCNNNMTGSAVISINPPPTPYTLSATGGGAYCTGSAVPHIILSGSDIGTQYQLMIGGVPTGLSVSGNGSPIDFGTQPVAGTYTVSAVNLGTTCTGNMGNSVIISINPLPTPSAVTGGGNYCVGGTGKHIGLSFSTSGVNYQLYLNSVPVSGALLSGTGGPIDFGLETATGTYTVVGINTTTGCSNNMTGSKVIGTTPLPTVYGITGGGGYCAGGLGSPVGLSASNAGIDYQLYNGTIPIGGTMHGTGGVLSFGLQPVAGTYTIVGTNSSTGCSSTMAGSVSINVNLLPNIYTVTGGGNYCAGSAGKDVSLFSTDLNVKYQLYYNGSPSGLPIMGTGSALDFGIKTAAGTYTVVGINATTGCTATMSGSAIISVSPLPNVYTVTGGGKYCAGGTGFHIDLSGSDVVDSYQLFNSGVAVTGAIMSGTGAALDFGAQTAGGMYTVVATNTSTGCSANMSSGASIVVNPAPTKYVVRGGGSYCAGGTGVDISLSYSNLGITYQLYNGATPAGFSSPGVNSGIDFGLHAAPGTYTVIATNPATGCTATMDSDATVSITAWVKPAVTISSDMGLTECAGTTTTFTAAPVNGGATPVYQWMVNGAPVTGIDSAYIYTPTNLDVVSVLMTSSVQCPAPLTAKDEVRMNVNPIGTPAVFITEDPGLSVCQGTNVTFTASTPVFGGTSPIFYWMQGGVVVGTGSTYNYVPNNSDVVTLIMASNYACITGSDSASTSATMTVQAPVTPVFKITSSTSATGLSLGKPDTLTATITSGGPATSYQWILNTTPLAGETSNTLVRSFFNKDSVTCVVVGTGNCGSNTVSQHIVLTVRNTTGATAMNVSGTDIRVVPNPNKGAFTIKGTLGTTVDEEVSLEITNMLGQSVYSNKVMAHSGNINEQVQLSNTLANGMYILSVRSGSENSVFHFVIEQ